MDFLSMLDAAEHRLFLGIPDAVKSRLTEQEMLSLLRAVKPVPTSNGLALRASFRFFAERYYVAWFFGRDCRSIERLRAEGQLDAIPVGISFFILLGVIAAYGLFPIACMLYLFKSALGINIFDGPSPFHVMICG